MPYLGQRMQGFTKIRQEHLSEVSGQVTLWRHDATGAQILSVCNDDENKCFGVTFRTPPQDSTGVAHILEHSVLCGSEKYPVKEPFVELLKGSLQTFLNAFTYPDKTCYPVASANLQDFYNLVQVYLDAVFFPRISEDTFKQEGWHAEADATRSGDLHFAYKGVVYNEMKGVYSSPDSVLMEETQHALFPNTLYSLDSGGNPATIPNLTYEAFKNFHTTHYTPSNARFFFWGDDPEEKRFELILPYLSRFQKRDIHDTIPLQPHLDSPRLLEFPFAAPEESADKGHVTVSWLLCENNDCETVLLLEMLDHILLGLPGSPLRKALIDSGLGEDLAGNGLENDLRQVFFSTGLRSIDPNKARDVEVLIMDTLADLVDQGIPDQVIEAAVNSVEFDLRENNSGRFPRGLAAMLRSLTTWLYDGDPFAPLAWEKPLRSIKKRLADGEKIFEQTLRQGFLENSHRAMVLLKPEPDFATRQLTEEHTRCDQFRDSLSDVDQRKVLAEAGLLQVAQAKPDSPEALATIPSLTVDDLPRKNAFIPSKTGECRGKQTTLATLTHDLDTSGILYAELLLPLDKIDVKLLPFLPLFGRCLTEMGTTKHDFVSLGTLLASKTGGIEAEPLILSHVDRSPKAYLCLSGKATADKIPELFDLMQEILLDVRLDDRLRFTQMVLEERARMEQSIIPAGHGLVATRLRSALSPAGWINEQIGGVSYLESLRNLDQRLEQNWSSVLADLEKLRESLIQRQGALLNLTADEALLQKALIAATPMIDALSEGSADSQWKIPDQQQKVNEALLVPAQVNYVGKACNLFDLGYVWNGSAHVILRHVQMAWLWDQVRVQGGAYGVFCKLDRLSGILTQVSYRDPNVKQTLTAFDSESTWLRNIQLSKRDLNLAIVGAIGDVDTYLLPDAKGMLSLSRMLCGNTETMRQQSREEMLSTTQKDFNNFAEIMAEASKAGHCCALGGSAVEKVADEENWNKKRLL